jgi:DNA-binding HxlR family transcriptional regulator
MDFPTSLPLGGYDSSGIGGPDYMNTEQLYCPVHDAIQVLQEKWTMHIVRALLPGPMGFNELGRTVGGCNPATLKVRLDHLEALGILRRTVHSQMPPRTSYELSASGIALQRVIDAIDAWAREHLDDGVPSGAMEPTVAVG